MKKTGKFITVEGTEGVGKSTNIAFIEKKIRSKNIDVVVTREPGGTDFAEELRDILLKRRSEKVDPTSELLTVFAARAQHLSRLIKPALDSGQWVLSDRFTDATYAYQGYGRQLNLNLITTLEDIVQGTLRPDCTFLLDIDVQVGLDRVFKRSQVDRFESEKVAFFERVRNGYLARARSAPEQYCIVDASNTLEQVQKDIASCLDMLLR